VERGLYNTRELSPLREIPRDNLNATFTTHHHWAGIYRKALERHPEFAVDLLMDMQNASGWTGGDYKDEDLENSSKGMRPKRFEAMRNNGQ
jgi:hypothetical protein